MAQKPREVGDLESLIVQKIREHLGVSQIAAAQISEQTGIPESTLSKTLNCKRSSNLVELQAIVNALGLRLSDVIKEAERELAPSSPSTSKLSNVTQLHPRRSIPEPDFTAMAAHETRRDPREDYEQADYE